MPEIKFDLTREQELALIQYAVQDILEKEMEAQIDREIAKANEEDN